MMRREGRSGDVWGFGLESNMKGDGREGAGGVKLLRSSKKNREGGGNSVNTSSISPDNAQKVKQNQNICLTELLTVNNQVAKGHRQGISFQVYINYLTWCW